MIQIDTLTVGSYETNCYIVRAAGSSTCVVIDPGYEPRAVWGQIQALGLEIQAILLTHGHFDHVGGVKALQKEARCPVYLHPADLTLPESLTAGPLEPTNLLEDGQTLELAGLSLRVLSTPGHTPGSVCYVAEEALFSGDTLFCRSCGRTDLPGGSWPEMEGSLKRLGALDYHGPVYPGHGPATHMDRERAYNPYLQEAMGL